MRCGKRGEEKGGGKGISSANNTRNKEAGSFQAYRLIRPCVWVLWMTASLDKAVYARNHRDAKEERAKPIPRGAPGFFNRYLSFLAIRIPRKSSLESIGGRIDLKHAFLANLNSHRCSIASSDI